MFVEEIQTTMTEGVYIYRQTLLETYHKVGKMLALSDVDVKTVSKDSGISEALLKQCAKFYEKFPKMEKLPDGKNISWAKVKKLL